MFGVWVSSNQRGRKCKVFPQVERKYVAFQAGVLLPDEMDADFVNAARKHEKDEVKAQRKLERADENAGRGLVKAPLWRSFEASLRSWKRELR